VRDFLIVVPIADAALQYQLLGNQIWQSPTWHTQINLGTLTNIKTEVGATCVERFYPWDWVSFPQIHSGCCFFTLSRYHCASNNKVTVSWNALEYLEIKRHGINPNFSALHSANTVPWDVTVFLSVSVKSTSYHA